MIKSLNNGSWQETEMQSWLLAGSSLMNRFVLVVMMVTGDGDDGDDDDDGDDGILEISKAFEIKKWFSTNSR